MLFIVFPWIALAAMIAATALAVFWKDGRKLLALVLVMFAFNVALLFAPGDSGGSGPSTGPVAYLSGAAFAVLAGLLLGSVIRWIRGWIARRRSR